MRPDFFSLKNSYTQRMCGIFGYVGKKEDAVQVVITGLKRLEYRGYDSWGIGVVNRNSINVIKKVGAIGDVKRKLNLPKSSAAIAHTRWATHGGVTEINAHPHFSTSKDFILAQNGIVENYAEIKNYIKKKNYSIKTETDTEIIVRLIEDKMKHTHNLLEAVRQTVLELKGRNTIIILNKDGRIIAARNGSPLVIGSNGEDESIYISSDTLSFASFCQKMVVVDNGFLVDCFNGSLKIYNTLTGKETRAHWEDIQIRGGRVDKEGFDHFMIKEIHEAPYVIRQLINQEKSRYVELAHTIKRAKTVYTIGSGTTGIAAAQIAFYLRVFGHINAINIIGADALDYLPLMTKNDLIIAPSQSGETADVLEVLEKVKGIGIKIASFVNMPGSMMTKISDYKFMANAGAEICVMSTKVFVSQIAWGYLVAKTVAEEYESGLINLKKLAISIEKYFQNKKGQEEVKKLASEFKNKKDIFLLAKYQNYQIVREGMVKLIEGTYKHAHAIPAGDLKHYAITLIEKGVPVIVVLSNDKVQSEVINAVNEVRTRGAEVIGIATKNHESFHRFLSVPDTGETSAIINIIPLQLLAYYMTRSLGHNVDKPRNIAKSVTVK